MELKVTTFVFVLMSSTFGIDAKPLENINFKTTEEKTTGKPDTTAPKISETICNDCIVDYDVPDKPRNDFIEVMADLNGQDKRSFTGQNQNYGLSTKTIGFLSLVSVCGISLIGLFVFFLLKLTIRRFR